MSITSEAQATVAISRSRRWARDLLDYGLQTIIERWYLQACSSPSPQIVYMPFTTHLPNELADIQALLSAHYFALVAKGCRPSKIMTTWESSNLLAKLVGYNEADNTLNFFEPHTLTADYCPPLDKPRNFVTCIVNGKMSGNSYKFE